jgi:hypothetical protein
VAVAAKQAKEAREGLETALDAQRTYFELVETGTAEEIQNAILSQEATLKAREAERAALEAQISSLNLFARIFTQADKALNDQLKETEADISQLGAELGALNDALGSEEVRSRSKAEKVSTQATVAATRAEKARNVTLEQTQRQLKKTQSVERERTRTVSAQTANLTFNGRQWRRNAKDQKDSANEIVKTQNEIAKIQNEIRSTELEAIRKAGDRRQDIIQKGLDADFMARIKSEQARSRIRREGARSEQSARRRRDFEALADIKEQTQERLKEQRIQFNQEEKERKIAQDQALRDLDINLRRERRERFIRNQARLNDIRNVAQQELSITSSKLGQSVNIFGQAGQAFVSIAANTLNGIQSLGATSGDAPGRGSPGVGGLFSNPFQGQAITGTTVGLGGVNVSVSGNTFNDKQTMAKIAGDIAGNEARRLVSQTITELTTN